MSIFDGKTLNGWDGDPKFWRVIMIDEAKVARAMEGVLGLQMHVGPPFTIEYRNLLYREL